MLSRRSTRPLTRTPSRLFALALATVLTACGGGNSPASQAPAVVQKAADGAVARGLVGVTLVHLSGTETTAARAGVRQAGAAAPIEAGDAFLIGSTTKAMTAALAARLVEQGRIAWTTTLAEALPDLAEGMRPEYRAVTLAQLLDHRGGVLAMNNGADTERFQAALEASTAPLLTTLAGRERYFAAWLLTQTPVLAALMLQARTGRTYADLFEQELARPLGFTVSWTSDDVSFTQRPVGHGGTAAKPTALVPLDADTARWLDVLRPGGVGTTITPASYATWVGWHLRALQGTATPLAASYVRRLQSLKAGDYALGWIATDVDGRPVLAHDGEYRGFSSMVAVDARGRSASFGFTNTEADDGTWTLAAMNQALLDIERALPPAP
jgi:CubicO group peptidase (beta-lactamase class C family)